MNTHKAYNDIYPIMWSLVLHEAIENARTKPREELEKKAKELTNKIVSLLEEELQ